MRQRGKELDGRWGEENLVWGSFPPVLEINVIELVLQLIVEQIVAKKC